LSEIATADHSVDHLVFPHWCILVRPFPDELAQGYGERLALLNDCDSLDIFISRVGSEAAWATRVPKVTFLATASGLTTQTFVREHTLTPFFRAFASDDRTYAHGADNENHLRYEAMRVPATSKYCHDCWIEDCQSPLAGYPFLRRSHLVPGVRQCSKHDRALARATPAILRAYLSGESVTPVEPPSIDESPALIRYEQLAMQFLERSAPIPLSWLHNALNRQRHKLGLRLRGKPDGRPVVSDLVFRLVPIEWLLQNITGSDQKEPDEYFDVLDRTTRRGSTKPIPAAIIVLATVFEDTDDALNSVLAANGPPNLVSRQVAVPGIGDDQILAAYISSGYRYAEAATSIGTSRVPFRMRCNAMSLPPSSLMSVQANRLSHAEFLQGKTIAEACAIHGAKPDHVEAIQRFNTYVVRRAVLAEFQRYRRENRQTSGAVAQ